MADQQRHLRARPRRAGALRGAADRRGQRQRRGPGGALREPDGVPGPGLAAAGDRGRVPDLPPVGDHLRRADHHQVWLGQDPAQRVLLPAPTSRSTGATPLGRDPGAVRPRARGPATRSWPTSSATPIQGRTGIIASSHGIRQNTVRRRGATRARPAYGAPGRLLRRSVHALGLDLSRRCSRPTWNGSSATSADSGDDVLTGDTESIGNHGHGPHPAGSGASTGLGTNQVGRCNTFTAPSGQVR